MASLKVFIEFREFREVAFICSFCVIDCYLNDARLLIAHGLTSLFHVNQLPGSLRPSRYAVWDTYKSSVRMQDVLLQKESDRRNEIGKGVIDLIEDDLFGGRSVRDVLVEGTVRTVLCKHDEKLASVSFPDCRNTEHRSCTHPSS